MFDERKVICAYLVLLAILPFLENPKDWKVIIPWLSCSCLFFIFPFLSTNIEDNIYIM